MKRRDGLASWIMHCYSISSLRAVSATWGRFRPCADLLRERRFASLADFVPGAALRLGMIVSVAASWEDPLVLTGFLIPGGVASGLAVAAFGTVVNRVQSGIVRRKAAAAELARTQAEVRALRAQSNPHFCSTPSTRSATLCAQTHPRPAICSSISPPSFSTPSARAISCRCKKRSSTSKPTLIVFPAAYDEHALRAFELAALDYVVKRFDERRLAQTVERIRQTLVGRGQLADRQPALREYLARVVPGPELTKLWGQRENESWLLVDFRDIMWIVAESKRLTTPHG